MSKGNMETMLPKGCTIETAPCDLTGAITHAMTVLNWQEHLSSDEMPARWKWHLDWEMNDHFEWLKKHREEKYGKSNASSADEEPEEIWENELSARFK